MHFAIETSMFIIAGFAAGRIFINLWVKMLKFLDYKEVMDKVTFAGSFFIFSFWILAAIVLISSFPIWGLIFLIITSVIDIKTDNYVNKYWEGRQYE